MKIYNIVILILSRMLVFTDTIIC